MRKSASNLGLAVGLLVWCGGMLVSGDSSATLSIQKQAKEAGLPAANCLYCHGEKLPKKDAVTHNDRGNWLIKEKEKRKATAVDGAWLKDYQEKK